MNLLRVVVAIACMGMVLNQAAFAAEASLQDDIHRIDVEQIDRDPTWLALLHYRARGDGGMQSDADRPQFFMSAHGKHSPRAELLAGVTALHTPDQTQDFACRFPARHEWLRIRLGHDGASTDFDQCPQLAKWMAGFPGRRISINFASSYLENPSSTFGHTFLKIFQQSSSELLSPTINYAARTDERDGELGFILKGLFGGFPGIADELPFYRRLRTYAEIEGRDIHEYELALTPDEVRRLLLHTWEIKDGIFDYYFVHENCAYRTLALIDVVRPHAGLLKGFTAITVPVDTIRALRSAGVLGEQRVWPSVPKYVRDLEAQLTEQEATTARRLALGLSGGNMIEQLPPVRRTSTLQLAYEYGSVLIDRDEGDRTRRKEILGAITNARLKLDSPDMLASLAMPANPEDGHDGGLVAIGIRRRDGQNAISLEYAAFQHTLTNPSPGYEPHAEIKVLNPELVVQDGKLRLQRIDWLAMQSAIPSSPLFAAHAWRLQLSSGRQPFADREAMATSVAYHSGKAWTLGKNMVLSVLPGASIEISSALPQHAGVAGVLRTSLTRQGKQWSAQLEILAEKFMGRSALLRYDTRATAEFRLSRNLSVAIRANLLKAPLHQRELQFSLNWRYRSLSHPLTRE